MKHITKIEYIDDKKCRVITDTFDVLELDTFTVSTSTLKEGESCEDEVFEAVVQQSECIRAEKEGMKYLSSRMHTAKQLQQHITEKGFDEDIARQTVEKLSSWGYIDDEAYAKAYIEYRLNGSKKSWRAIAYDLKLEGVDMDVITCVLEEYDTDEYQRALAVAKKITRGKTDEKTIKKLHGTLSRNGYNWEAISYAVRKLSSDVEYEE